MVSTVSSVMLFSFTPRACDAFLSIQTPRNCVNVFFLACHCVPFVISCPVNQAADIVRCFVDHESLEGKGDEQEGQGSRRVLHRDHLDPDLDSMSDDSLSDDSFHPELSSTTGPITPPQTPRTTERMLPSATVTTDSGTFFGGKSDQPGFGRDIGVAKPPRQPIGAVADLGAKENVGNAGGSGAGVWDISAETPVTGNAGKARFFGNIC